jgi:hypothetical protein
MEAARALNLIDVDGMVEEFLTTHQSSIANMHRLYFQTGNQLSLHALTELLKGELRTGCVTYVNKGSPMDGLKSYLFYIANAMCRKLSSTNERKKSEYICPGCLFLGMATLISFDKNFRCDECHDQLKKATDPKKIFFYKTFAIHNKKGYRCPDCNRFIPHPLENVSTVSCPYFDCMFVGNYQDLRVMHHTTSQTNPEKLVLDVTQDGARFFKDNLVSDSVSALTSLEMKEELQRKIEVIQDVIDSQISHVAYSGSDFTIKHKQCVYQAFSLLLKRQPDEMVSYLLDGSRSGGFQHKAFQEYIRLLEESMPFFIKKGNKRYRIDNLLSEHLSIFSGISVFSGTVTDRLDIKNGTTEYYIGGRKGSYTEPYFIGKLLSVLQTETKEPLLHLVKEYSFSRIKFRDITPGTPVTITHLRIPPHYQMGGMVYVNRVRKKIVERAQAILKQDDTNYSSVEATSRSY